MCDFWSNFSYFSHFISKKRRFPCPTFHFHVSPVVPCFSKEICVFSSQSAEWKNKWNEGRCRGRRGEKECGKRGKRNRQIIKTNVSIRSQCLTENKQASLRSFFALSSAHSGEKVQHSLALSSIHAASVFDFPFVCFWCIQQSSGKGRLSLPVLCMCVLLYLRGLKGGSSLYLEDLRNKNAEPRSLLV